MAAAATAFASTIPTHTSTFSNPFSSSSSSSSSIYSSFSSLLQLPLKKTSLSYGGNQGPSSAKPFAVSCVLSKESKAQMGSVQDNLPVLQRLDSLGPFGKYGGKYVPEALMEVLTELESADKALSTHYQFQTIKLEDLEVKRKLGSGGFGTVYHGKWREADVAIKFINKSCYAGPEQERLTAELRREADILSKLHHPYVTAFYGVAQDEPDGTLAIVAEFMPDGSLRQVLHRKDRHLDLRKKLIIAMDIAVGMEYLHSKNIVHFDLKCDNLLVNMKDSSRPICKVGDLGLSKIKRNTLISGGVRGTLAWIAPELLDGGSNKVSEKVDVYSYGIVLWEITTHEEPYANMHYGAIIGGVVNNTLRPTIPSDCDPDLRRLMEQCWSPDPAARPSFTEIVNQLRIMSAAC